MNTKSTRSVLLLVLALLGFLILSGCALVTAISGLIPNTKPTVDPGTSLPPVVGPEAARQVALDFLQSNYGSYAPPVGVFWVGGEMPSAGLVGLTRFQYTAAGWVVDVSYPLVAPEATLYKVDAQCEGLGFSWQGLVEANGKVATVSVVLNDTSATSQDIEPENTAIPATPTAIPATLTPIPATPTPKPTATAVPRPCNAAKFVADVTIQDGTTFGPNTGFTKTWRLENVGACNWTSDYDLIFVDGSRMEASKAISLPGRVRPDERVDLSVAMISPSEAGDYRGFWMLRSDDGEVFGIGSAANKAFWVSITVVEPPEDYAYDFAFYFCQATWRSDEGRLSCPETGDPADGFVRLLKEPALENRRDNELALWVHPNEERYGWIEGTYPAFKVGAGDRFQAWVGCLEGYEKCSLKFYLDYEDKDGKVRRLGEWIEEYDGEVSTIDIDLSSLAGESVRFILGTEALTWNTDAAQGFWFVPRLD